MIGIEIVVAAQDVQHVKLEFGQRRQSGNVAARSAFSQLISQYPTSEYVPEAMFYSAQAYAAEQNPNAGGRRALHHLRTRTAHGEMGREKSGRVHPWPREEVGGRPKRADPADALDRIAQLPPQQAQSMRQSVRRR